MCFRIAGPSSCVPDGRIHAEPAANGGLRAMAACGCVPRSSTAWMSHDKLELTFSVSAESLRPRNGPGYTQQGWNSSYGTHRGSAGDEDRTRGAINSAGAFSRTPPRIAPMRLASSSSAAMVQNVRQRRVNVVALPMCCSSAVASERPRASGSPSSSTRIYRHHLLKSQKSAADVITNWSATV